MEAQHDIMRTRIFLLQIMAVIGAHQWDPELLMDLDEAAVRRLLMRQAVGLNLEVVPALTEDLLILTRHTCGTLHILLADQIRHLSTEAARQRNESLVVFRQQSFVHPGLVIEALEIGLADQFNEILIAGPVGGEQNEVIVVVVRKMPLLGKPAFWR